MNDIIASIICRSTLEYTECWSRDKKNCPWFETSDGANILVLPRVSISEDLDNSTHIDVSDDTCTFAVFHPSEPKTLGLSWFLFPAHGIIIQISCVVMMS